MVPGGSFTLAAVPAFGFPDKSGACSRLFLEACDAAAAGPLEMPPEAVIVELLCAAISISWTNWQSSELDTVGATPNLCAHPTPVVSELVADFTGF